MPQFKYFAFISYSHADRSWGDWLHKALETYPIPSRLVGRDTGAGPIPKSLAPIFRDRDELPSATDLSRKVNEALAQSANLIVICSPHSAASRWVNEEILGFKRLGRADRVFCLVVGGEPNASDLPGRASEECFSPALRFVVGADGNLTVQRTEPIAADARPGKDGKQNAKLKLISGLLDIGFDELRQREQQRRTRRMAAITALALVVMTVTIALAISAVIARNSAEVARQAAERRQKQAEHLVGFMLGDLNDKLAQVQRLDIMEAVDDQAMQCFQSLPTTDVTDEALAQRAKALEKIGSVRMDQGNLPAAMQAYRSSLKFAAALAAAAPKNPERQMAYARTWSFIGKNYWYQGRLEDALRGFRSAQAILVRAEVLAPADRQFQFELATTENNIGHVLESRGRLDEAMVHYRRVLALCGDLVAVQPGNVEWATALGSAHNNLGSLALLRGDLATAVAEYRADDRIEAALTARDPKDNNQREQMAIARATLARTLALSGDLDSGIRGLRESVDIANQLRVVDPNNTSFQEDVALYGSQLAGLLRQRGDLSGATQLSARSLANWRALTRQEPSNARWQQGLAEATLEHAEQLRAGHQAEAARVQALAAEKTLRALLLQQPDDRAVLLAATATQLLLADLDEKQDETAATRMRNEALQKLTAVTTADPRVLALQVRTLIGLGRTSEAEVVFQRLRRGGYRDPGEVTLMDRTKVDTKLDVTHETRIKRDTRRASLVATTSTQPE